MLNKSKHEHIKDSIPQRGLTYVSADLANPTDMVLVALSKILPPNKPYMTLRSTTLGQVSPKALSSSCPQFNPSGDFYMAFKIKSFDEVEYPGLNIAYIKIHGGKSFAAPYFATVNDLKTK